MLEPQSRQLLLNSLHPPDGYRLDWAVGTTYSLDLLAILSAPVAFAFSDWHDKEGRPTLDPLALLKAVRQYADRICLFCQAGKIYVPQSYQPLLTNLEESIVEATALQHSGIFHPKVWFLRYVKEDDAVIYRVLCLSRNMTFDRSWDTMLSLEGPLRDRTLAFSRNNPLGQFVAALPFMAVRKLSPTWKKRLDQLAHEIRRVDFEVPEPFEDLAFWPLGIGDRAEWPFQGRIDQMLVVSPFIDDAFINDLEEHQTRIQLLSRPDSIAALDTNSLKQFQKIWILDDTMELEGAELEDSNGNESEHTIADGESVVSGECGIPLVGLHAKVYVADVGWDAYLWTGSANATKAAFSRNIELLVQLKGKRSCCGVDAVLGEPTTYGKKTKELPA